MKRSLTSDGADHAVGGGQGQAVAAANDDHNGRGQLHAVAWGWCRGEGREQWSWLTEEACRRGAARVIVIEAPGLAPKCGTLGPFGKLLKVAHRGCW